MCQFSTWFFDWQAKKFLVVSCTNSALKTFVNSSQKIGPPLYRPLKVVNSFAETHLNIAIKWSQMPIARGPLITRLKMALSLCVLFRVLFKNLLSLFYINFPPFIYRVDVLVAGLLGLQIFWLHFNQFICKFSLPSRANLFNRLSSEQWSAKIPVLFSHCEVLKFLFVLFTRLLAVTFRPSFSLFFEIDSLPAVQKRWQILAHGPPGRNGHPGQVWVFCPRQDWHPWTV